MPPKMPKQDQKRLAEYQLRMRKRPTKAESQFKKDILRLLHGRYGIKATNQKMIWEVNSKNDKKAYILDFYIPSLKMAIEIDGASHNSKRAQVYDQIRDSLAAKKGIRVIRFTNEDVKDTDKCIKRIYQEIERWQQFNLARTKPAEPIDRADELEMQQKFIAEHGIKYLPTVGENRKPTR